MMTRPRSSAPSATLSPGSYLVLSHVTGDIRRESAAPAAMHYKKVTSGATLRGQDENLRFSPGWS
jgi:hypothetical protein